MKSILTQLALVSVVATGCARTTPLETPYPIQAAASPAATEAAILRALGQRGWVVQQRYVGAVDAIYASMKENNKDLDVHIGALKAAMLREGAKEAVFEPAKLAQNNRQGRKLMQSYFRKKGVAVSFGA